MHGGMSQAGSADVPVRFRWRTRAGVLARSHDSSLRRRDGPDPLKQAEEVQLGALLHDAAILHLEHVDAAQLDGPAGGGDAGELAAGAARQVERVKNNTALPDLVSDFLGKPGKPVSKPARRCSKAARSMGG